MQATSRRARICRFGRCVPVGKYGGAFMKTAEQKTILVVDDDPGFLVALTPLLEKAGYRAITARDAKEAQASLENGTFIDAAVVDLALPDVGGLQVIARICKGGERA